MYEWILFARDRGKNAEFKTKEKCQFIFCAVLQTNTLGEI